MKKILCIFLLASFLASCSSSNQGALTYSSLSSSSDSSQSSSSVIFTSENNPIASTGNLATAPPASREIPSLPSLSNQLPTIPPVAAMPTLPDSFDAVAPTMAFTMPVYFGPPSIPVIEIADNNPSVATPTALSQPAGTSTPTWGTATLPKKAASAKKNTRYAAASSSGVIGLPAHDTLAGAYFPQIKTGEVLKLTGSNGQVYSYQVQKILSFQALSPNDPYSDFREIGRFYWVFIDGHTSSGIRGKVGEAWTFKKRTLR